MPARYVSLMAAFDKIAAGPEEQYPAAPITPQPLGTAGAAAPQFNFKPSPLKTAPTYGFTAPPPPTPEPPRAENKPAPTPPVTAYKPPQRTFDRATYIGPEEDWRSGSVVKSAPPTVAPPGGYAGRLPLLSAVRKGQTAWDATDEYGRPKYGPQGTIPYTPGLEEPVRAVNAQTGMAAQNAVPEYSPQQMQEARNYLARGEAPQTPYADVSATKYLNAQLGAQRGTNADAVQRWDARARMPATQAERELQAWQDSNRPRESGALSSVPLDEDPTFMIPAALAGGGLFTQAAGRGAVTAGATSRALSPEVNAMNMYSRTMRDMSARGSAPAPNILAPTSGTRNMVPPVKTPPTPTPGAWGLPNTVSAPSARITRNPANATVTRPPTPGGIPKLAPGTAGPLTPPAATAARTEGAVATRAAPAAVPAAAPAATTPAAAVTNARNVGTGLSSSPAARPLAPGNYTATPSYTPTPWSGAVTRGMNPAERTGGWLFGGARAAYGNPVVRGLTPLGAAHHAVAAPLRLAQTGVGALKVMGRPLVSAGRGVAQTIGGRVGRFADSALARAQNLIKNPMSASVGQRAQQTLGHAAKGTLYGVGGGLLYQLAANTAHGPEELSSRVETDPMLKQHAVPGRGLYGMYVRGGVNLLPKTVGDAAEAMGFPQANQELHNLDPLAVNSPNAWEYSKGLLGAERDLGRKGVDALSKLDIPELERMGRQARVGVNLAIGDAPGSTAMDLSALQLQRQQIFDAMSKEYEAVDADQTLTDAQRDQAVQALREKYRPQLQDVAGRMQQIDKLPTALFTGGTRHPLADAYATDHALAAMRADVEALPEGSYERAYKLRQMQELEAQTKSRRDDLLFQPHDPNAAQQYYTADDAAKVRNALGLGATNATPEQQQALQKAVTSARREPQRALDASWNRADRELNAETDSTTKAFTRFGRTAPPLAYYASDGGGEGMPPDAYDEVMRRFGARNPQAWPLPQTANMAAGGGMAGLVSPAYIAPSAPVDKDPYDQAADLLPSSVGQTAATGFHKIDDAMLLNQAYRHAKATGDPNADVIGQRLNEYVAGMDAPGGGTPNSNSLTEAVRRDDARTAKLRNRADMIGQGATLAQWGTGAGLVGAAAGLGAAAGAQPTADASAAGAQPTPDAKAPAAPGTPLGESIRNPDVSLEEAMQAREKLQPVLRAVFGGGGIGSEMAADTGGAAGAAALTAATAALEPPKGFERYWDTLESSSKILAIAGVSMAGIGLLRSLFSDDEDDEESFLMKALPFIGIGAAAWGLGGGTFSSLPSLSKYKELGNAAADKFSDLTGWGADK